MTATTWWVQMRRKLHLHDTSTTEHLQLSSCDIKQQSWQTTAEHENKRIQDIKRTNTSVAPSQKKKQPNSR